MDAKFHSSSGLQETEGEGGGLQGLQGTVGKLQGLQEAREQVGRGMQGALDIAHHEMRLLKFDLINHTTDYSSSGSQRKGGIPAGSVLPEQGEVAGDEALSCHLWVQGWRQLWKWQFGVQIVGVVWGPTGSIVVLGCGRLSGGQSSHCKHQLCAQGQQGQQGLDLGGRNPNSHLQSFLSASLVLCGPHEVDTKSQRLAQLFECRKGTENCCSSE